MANTPNQEAEAGKYIGLGLAIAGTLAIGLCPPSGGDGAEC
jgi:hypothetical protein